VRVLSGHVQILLSELRQSPQCLAGWIVQSFPFVLSSDDQVSEQNSRDCSMRHAVAGITGSDKNISFVQRISADKGQTIYRLNYLSRPLKLDLFDDRKASSGPSFKRRESLVGAIGLAGFVILAPDDQDVMLVSI